MLRKVQHINIKFLNIYQFISHVRNIKWLSVTLIFDLKHLIEGKKLKPKEQNAEISRFFFIFRKKLKSKEQNAEISRYFFIFCSFRFTKIKFFRNIFENTIYLGRKIFLITRSL